MTDNTYNGWTNWDTWNANLWLTNDEHSYKQARMAYSGAKLELTFVDLFGNGHDGIDCEEVNWQEIYNSLNE